jgi:hypothetical protein
LIPRVLHIYYVLFSIESIRVQFYCSQSNSVHHHQSPICYQLVKWSWATCLRASTAWAKQPNQKDHLLTVLTFFNFILWFTNLP